ncbi:MAG: methyltransferase family protein [Candidatus Thorarchaeota archaeon]
MTSDTETEKGSYNFWRPLFAIINFGSLLLYGGGLMRTSADLWDFIFVMIGCYFTLKFVRYLSKAHQFTQTRMQPKDMSEFPTEGIYGKIRQPVSAAIIYMNLAYVCFYRSIVMIPVVAIFIALWYMIARYEDQMMLSNFGDEYKIYMRGTALLRGGSEEQQRLASSGYDMY